MKRQPSRDLSLKGHAGLGCAYPTRIGTDRHTAGFAGGGAVRAGASNSGMLKIEWTNAAAALPDDDTLVLVALDDTEIWPGWRDGDTCRHLDAVRIMDARVTHWMHMPPAPGVTR